MEDDLDIPDSDELLEGGGGAPRISLKLGGLEVEVEGCEEDSLEEVEETYNSVLEDALERSESVSQALRDRLMGWM